MGDSRATATDDSTKRSIYRQALARQRNRVVKAKGRDANGQSESKSVVQKDDAANSGNSGVSDSEVSARVDTKQDYKGTPDKYPDRGQRTGEGRGAEAVDLSETETAVGELSKEAAKPKRR